MDAIAVTIVIIAVVILVVMTGIGGYALGRASAADDAEKASEADRRLNETLVGCRDKVAVVCFLWFNLLLLPLGRLAGRRSRWRLATWPPYRCILACPPKTTLPRNASAAAFWR